VDQVRHDFLSAPISAKLKALLNIAGKVQQSGKNVTTTDIEAARNEGATDIEIHDTVLIAAIFCMYNRYVDGLGTWTPSDQASYRERSALVAAHGYMRLPSLIAARQAEAAVGAAVDTAAIT
jgi:hypothetical protein